MDLKPLDVQLSALKLRVYESPSNGPALVLIHGLTGRHDSYDPVIPELLKSHRVFAIDQRGHGESGHVSGKYAIGDYTGDLIELIQELGIAPALVWGQSLGAAVTLRAAGERPDLFKAIVLEDPPLRSRSSASSLMPVFEKWLKLAESDLSVDEIEKELSSLDTSALGAATRYKAETLHQLDPDVLRFAIEGTLWTDGRDPKTELEALRCPTLLMQADPAHGGIIPDEVIDQLSLLPANITHRRCAGSGHKVHASQPDVALRLVSEFLGKLPA